jgi:hypothetical protein
MTYLPNLIKRIDSFYSSAIHHNLTVNAAPMEQELYTQLASASKEIVNPDLSDNILILSEVFRRAVELGDGFNFIYQYIEAVKNDLDPEEPEQNNVENLLNHISASIRNRAGRADSPGALASLHEVARNTKRQLVDAEMERFQGQEDGTDEEPQMSAYEASLTGYREREDGEEQQEEGFGGEEDAKGTFDFTGGVSPEDAQKGKGRGYSFQKKNTLLEWAGIYAKEKAKYQEDLTGPEVMLSNNAKQARRNTGVRSNLQDLIGVLTELETLTKEADAIDHLRDTETEIAHPQEDKRFEQIKSTLRVLEKRRHTLKKMVQKFYWEANLKELDDKYAATQDPKEKFRLQQEMDLLGLRMSSSRGKGEEAKQRQLFIDALTNDPNLSQDMINKFKEHIQKSETITRKITEIYRKRALELAQRRQTKGEIATRTEREMGGVKRHEKYSVTTTQLFGYIQLLTDAVLAKRKTFKDIVIRRLKNLKSGEELRPFIDDVAKTATKAKVLVRPHIVLHKRCEKCLVPKKKLFVSFSR